MSEEVIIAGSTAPKSITVCGPDYFISDIAAIIIISISVIAVFVGTIGIIWQIIKNRNMPNK